MSRWFAFLLAAALVAGAAADTPANCTSEDVVGKWTLWRSMRAVKPGTDCAQDPVWAGLPWLHSVYVDLLPPNKAVDEFGNEGSWTMVHNQGVHIDVNGRTYFGYFAYSKDGRKITSYCQMVGRGLSHDVNMRHWACFYGQKSGYAHSKTHDDVLQLHGPLEGHLTKEDHQRVVAAVNARTQLWKAELHEPFSTLSAEDLLRVRGGRNSWTGPRPRAAPATPEQLRAAELLPPAFDWRDVNGVSYVSPGPGLVRLQLRLLLRGHDGGPPAHPRQQHQDAVAVASRRRELLRAVPGLRRRHPLPHRRPLRPGLRHGARAVRALHRKGQRLPPRALRPCIRGQLRVHRRLLRRLQRGRHEAGPGAAWAPVREPGGAPRLHPLQDGRVPPRHSGLRPGADARLRGSPRRAAGGLRRGRAERREVLGREEQLGPRLGRGRLLPHPPRPGRGRHREPWHGGRTHPVLEGSTLQDVVPMVPQKCIENCAKKKCQWYNSVQVWEIITSQH